jgi:two-component system nitrogen regulation sensor histidine kinase GlnL
MDFKKVLQSHPDGIAVFDRSLRLLFINPAMEAILENPPFPAPGKKNPDAGDIFPSSEEITSRLEEFVNGGLSYQNHDYLMKIPGKREMHMEVTISEIDYGGDSNGAILILRPTERKNELSNEVEKERKIDTLSLMAAGLAHEIRNPLGGIRGAAQLIGQKNPDLGKYSELIVNESDRISSLVGELLDLGGERKPVRKKLNIHKVLDDTIKLIEPAYKDKKLEIIRDYDPSLPELTGDPDKLKQVFINLSKNASEEMGKGGILRIKTRTSLDPTPTHESSGGRKKRTMMSVEFIDNGAGIPEEIAKNLFTPFNTGKKGGIGLGLIISLKIVMNHGGTLLLENNSAVGFAGGARKVGETHGATAKVVIPIE